MKISYVFVFLHYYIWLRVFMNLTVYPKPEKKENLSKKFL